MNIGFSLPNIGPIGTAEAITKVAQRAEALGYSTLWTIERLLYPVITESLVCMPTPSAGEKEKMIEAALKWCSNRVLDRKAGNAKTNPVSAREEIALVYKTTGCYRTR